MSDGFHARADLECNLVEGYVDGLAHVIFGLNDDGLALWKQGKIEPWGDLNMAVDVRIKKDEHFWTYIEISIVPKGEQERRVLATYASLKPGARAEPVDLNALKTIFHVRQMAAPLSGKVPAPMPFMYRSQKEQKYRKLAVTERNYGLPLVTMVPHLA